MVGQGAGCAALVQSRATRAIGAQSSDALAFAEAAGLSYRLQKRRAAVRPVSLVSYTTLALSFCRADVPRLLALVLLRLHEVIIRNRCSADRPPLVPAPT